MNGVVSTIEELATLLASPGKHLFIVKGEEIYLYESQVDAQYERLELFNEAEVQEGAWKGEFVWAYALIQKIKDKLPLGPMSGNLDADIIRNMVPDLLDGKLTQKQIRDMLGITDENNARVAEQKDNNFDDILNALLNDDDDDDDY